MTEPLGGIPTDAKIIIGVEADDDDTGWYSLHLHDGPNAVSVRPDEKAVVIGEGKGQGRLHYLRIPFENIFRFEAVRMHIGHDFFNSAGQTFAPVMLRLIIKHRDRQNFVSIRDLGATPSPTLVSLLNAPAEGAVAGDSIAPKSADDCFTLAGDVTAWVAKVNAKIKEEASVSEEILTRPSRQEVQRIYNELDRTKPDVLQTLVSAYAAIYVSVKLFKKLRLVRPVKICSSFPLNLTHEEAANKPPRNSTIEQLLAVSDMYQRETNRHIEEAYEVICEQIGDLKQRDVTINSSEKLKIFEDNAPRSITIIEPDKRINERLNEKRHIVGDELIDESLRVLDGHELRHEAQLRVIFDNEEVSIYHLEDLPFLSLLVQYETEGGKSHYAAVIKDEARPALKDFLLAHEMGHLFSHIYEDVHSSTEPRSEKLSLFLRSSANEDTFLEHEANDFGMALLFPPAYLADRSLFKGVLSKEDLLEEFLQGKEAGPKLRAQMLRRIGEHLDRYREFKKDTAPRSLTLEVKRIEEKDLDSLLKLIDSMDEPYYWIRLDKESDIVEASNNCVCLFGRSKEEIEALKPGDLVIEAERERMRKRAEYREQHKTAIFYFTEIWNEQEQTSRQVVVYSFPILREGEYVGAMAALKALDEIEMPSIGTLPQ